jgi:hypothetical protein
MKLVSVLVKLLSQDASEFMQLDPNEKLESILRYSIVIYFYLLFNF